MNYLCEQVGFEIENIRYNSNAGQFIHSHLYQEGIPFLIHSVEAIEEVYTEENIQYFTEATEKVNEKGYGNHAVFYIQHK